MKLITDSTALTELVRAYERFQFNNYVGLTDVNFTILYMSPTLLKISYASKVIDDVLGLNFFGGLAIVCRPPEVIARTKQFLGKVINEGYRAEGISINLKREAENVALHFRAIPLYNAETGNIIAMEFSGVPLGAAPLLVDPKKLFISKSDAEFLTSNDDLLNIREHEVLYLHFHCKSAKEIADKLSYIYNRSFSLHTIGKINQQLYEKFGVYNLEALLRIAQTKQYHKKIPLSLLSNHVIEIKDL